MQPPIRILLYLAITITTTHAICITTYLTWCDSIEDIYNHGERNWSEIIITSPTTTRTKLHQNTFEKTPNLEEIRIIEKLNSIEVGAFNNLHHLKRLQLYKNTIRTAKYGAFSNFKDLNKLDLRKNTIENIERGCFENSSITQLDISENFLTVIHTGVFNIKQLRRLTLSRNQLNSVATPALPDQLQHLDLSYNNLNTLELSLFENLSQLEVLLLNNNRFTVVVPLPGLASLKVFDVSYNDIQVTTKDAFTSYIKLETLRLNDNKLKYMNPASFSRDNRLQRISFHRNHMTFMPGEFGDIFKGLRLVSFGGNPWTCDCLSIIEQFVKATGLELEECDMEYFADGGKPVCLVTEYRGCFGNETDALFTSQMVGQFSVLVKGYQC